MGSQRPVVGRPAMPALALLLVLGWGGIATPPVQEQGLATDSVQIVPQIAEGASSTARGVFYQQTLALTLPGGPALLASSPDGQGWLCTDDQATLHFTAGDRPVLTWAHRFAGTDRRAIVCLPPQRLVLPIAAEYQIAVALEDLYPDAFSSGPYYLVFTAGTTPLETTPAPTALSATRAVTQQGSPTAIKTTPPTSLPVATSTRLSPTATFRATPSLPGSPPVTPPADDRRLVIGLIGVALLGLALLVVYWLNWRPAASPAITGILYLFDQETHEARTELLQGSARLSLRRKPLGLAAPNAPDTSGEIAQIRPSATGPILRDGETALTTPLIHDQQYTLAGGAVIVRYRSPGGRPPQGRG